MNRTQLLKKVHSGCLLIAQIIRGKSVKTVATNSTFVIIFIFKRMAAVVLTKESSLADQFLTELRVKRIQQDRRRFRENLEYLGSIMAYEIS